MKTVLPQSINTVEEAKGFLTELSRNNEAYHPEDSAASIGTLNEHILTESECLQLDKLMGEIYSLKGNEDYRNMVFDSCDFLLQLTGE